MAKSLLNPDLLSGSLTTMTMSNNFLFAGDLFGSVGSTTIQTDILKLNTVQVNMDPLASAALAELLTKVTTVDPNAPSNGGSTVKK